MNHSQSKSLDAFVEVALPSCQQRSVKGGCCQEPPDPPPKNASGG